MNIIKNTNKGITLVALVITIIVLLILAGISIAFLTGENGIITQAQKAKEESEKAKIREEVRLDVQDTYLQMNMIQPYEISSSDPNYSDWVTDGEGTITAYTGDLTEVVIPSKIGNETITKVGDNFYHHSSNHENIEKIIISKGIVELGSSAFQKMSGYSTNLRQIIISNSVTKIGASFISGQDLIKCVVLPEGVSKIGISSFSYCPELKYVLLPNSLQEIDVMAFNTYLGLEEIIIPESVDTIGWGGFYNCSNLKKVYCEAESKPAGWSNDWLYNCPNAEVVWGYSK